MWEGVGVRFIGIRVEKYVLFMISLSDSLFNKSNEKDPDDKIAVRRVK